MHRASAWCSRARSLRRNRPALRCNLQPGGGGLRVGRSRRRPGCGGQFPPPGVPVPRSDKARSLCRDLLCCRGETPLHKAAEGGSALAVQQLLELRAAVGPKNKNGRGPGEENFGT
eukprot:Skav205231  [mRNA]  locus=scaffold1794:117012:117359:+ [translate_table: standard]